MRKFWQVTVVVATIVTLASSAFAIVAAISSDSGRTKPAAQPAQPGTASSTSEAPPGDNASLAEVSIAKFAFEPRDLEVAAGTTVTWTNGDDVAHSVFTSDGALASPDLEQGDTYVATVDEPGTIAYYCDIHQYMKGTITVTS